MIIILSQLKFHKFILSFSYKLWYNYLKLRRKQIHGRPVTDPSYEEVNNAFERALVFMHKVGDATNFPMLVPLGGGDSGGPS